MIYQTTNNHIINRFPLPPREVKEGVFVSRCRYPDALNEHIRSIREDFNDMFTAELKKRLADGDLSFVFTLTYRNEHLKFRYGSYVVDSADLERFNKASALEKVYERAFGYRLDIVTIGEYGEGGITHGVVGSRGKGNNPHFHGAGWFHRIGDGDKKSQVRALLKIGYLEENESGNYEFDLYDALVSLFRYAWQQNLCPTIQDMSVSPVTNDGLGFCKLDGKIKHVGASSYFSKYMGKDMVTLHDNIYHDYFGKELYAVLFDFLMKDVGLNSVPSENLIYLFYKIYSVHSLQNYVKFHEYSDFLDNYNKKYILEQMFVHYQDFCDDFDSELNRFSPKLRHFRGFGYSLLDECDKVHGIYFAKRKRGTFARPLPSSLRRHLYYNYNIQLVERLDSDKVSHVEKVVRYTLNDLGRVFLRQQLNSSIQKDIIYLTNMSVSPVMAEQVAIFSNCIVSFCPLCDSDYDLVGLLYDRDAALDYAVSCRQEYVTMIGHRETRSFLDPLRYMQTEYPDIYDLYLKLFDFKQNLKAFKEKKSSDFLSHWSNIYLSTY